MSITQSNRRSQKKLKGFVGTTLKKLDMILKVMLWEGEDE
jgi:hypothetical protein